MPFSNAFRQISTGKTQPLEAESPFYRCLEHHTDVASSPAEAPPTSQQHYLRRQHQFTESLVSFQQILLVLWKTVLLREERFVALLIAIFLRNISLPKDWQLVSIQMWQCCLSLHWGEWSSPWSSNMQPTFWSLLVVVENCWGKCFGKQWGEHTILLLVLSL